jgi:outer membrane receptor protein involved in Fe transport
MRRSTAAGLVALVATTIGARARADDARPAPAEAPSPPATEVNDPTEVTVRGHREGKTFASTRAASTLRAREIRDRAPGSLADALRGSAGVSVQQTTPGQGTIYVRGLAGRELVLLVDGVRVNTAIFRSPNNAALGALDPYSFSSVDVIRGPSSVLHGSDALGGVVSIATTLPDYAGEGDARSRYSAFQALASNPVGTASRLSVQHREADWTAHVGATYAGYGDVVPGDSTRTPDPASFAFLERPVGGAYAPAMAREELRTGFQRLSADGAARRRLGAASEIVLRVQVSDRPRLWRYDEITPRFDPSGKPARAESTVGPLVRAMTSGTLAHRPADAFYDAALATLAWQRMSEAQDRRSMDETCATGGPASACTTRLRLVPAATLRHEATRSDAVSLRGELHFVSRDRTRGAVVGLEGVHDVVTSEAVTRDSVARTEARDVPRYPSGATMTQAGVFTQVETSPVRTLRLHAGARGALFALDLPGREGLAPDLGGRAMTSTLVDAAVTAGVAWQMLPGLSAVGNGGRGVRSPNVEDFAGFGTRAGGRFQLPNPGLGPEHVHSVDAGFKASAGTFRAQTFFFYSRFDDAIGVKSTSLNGQSATQDGARYVRSENASALDFYGVETDLRLGRADGAGLYVRALAMLYKENAAPGVSAAERVLAPPQLISGVWLHPARALRLEVFAHARGAMHRVLATNDTRVPPGGTSGFVTWHARAAWQATPDLVARLTLDNLTDALALEHGSGYYLPGVGATASLEAKLDR